MGLYIVFQFLDVNNEDNNSKETRKAKKEKAHGQEHFPSSNISEEIRIMSLEELEKKHWQNSQMDAF